MFLWSWIPPPHPVGRLKRPPLFLRRRRAWREYQTCRHRGTLKSPRQRQALVITRKSATSFKQSIGARGACPESRRGEACLARQPSPSAGVPQTGLCKGDKTKIDKSFLPVDWDTYPSLGEDGYPRLLVGKRRMPNWYKRPSLLHRPALVITREKTKREIPKAGEIFCRGTRRVPDL